VLPPSCRIALALRSWRPSARTATVGSGKSSFRGSEGQSAIDRFLAFTLLTESHGLEPDRARGFSPDALTIHLNFRRAAKKASIDGRSRLLPTQVHHLIAAELRRGQEPLGHAGEIWGSSGRKSVIQDDEHLLTVLRYIDANPLRAGMVTDLKDYAWTSHAAHGLGHNNSLLIAVPVWSRLAATEAERQLYWRRLAHEPLTERDLAALRGSDRAGGTVLLTACVSEVWSPILS
jgi:hypothetical protein